MADLRNIDKKLNKPFISFKTELTIMGVAIIGVAIITFSVLSLSNSDIAKERDIFLDVSYFEDKNIVEDFKFYFSQSNNRLNISILNYENCLGITKSIGCSMYPNSKNEGSWEIQDICVNPQTLEIGDIISFSSYDLKIQHRIISIDYENETLITKGDNNFFPDAEISFEQINGKVIAYFNATHYEEYNNSKCVVKKLR